MPAEPRKFKYYRWAWAKNDMPAQIAMTMNRGNKKGWIEWNRAANPNLSFEDWATELIEIYFRDSTNAVVYWQGTDEEDN